MQWNVKESMDPSVSSPADSLLELPAEDLSRAFMDLTQAGKYLT